MTMPTENDMTANGLGGLADPATHSFCVIPDAASNLTDQVEQLSRPP